MIWPTMNGCGRWLPALAAGLLLGCGEAGPPAASSQAAVVTVSQPLVREVTDASAFTGRTAAVESVDVRARVSGYLTTIGFQPGQEVKQGQLLFQIEPTVYEAALEKAQADVQQNEATVKLAESEYQRSRRLLENRSLSREELEKSAAQREQALASTASAKASVKTAKENLGWTKVVSPIDGKVGVNLLTKGNLVVADQTLLTTVVSQDPMYAYFDVDENTVLRIQQLIREGKATSYQKAAYPIYIGLTSETGYPHRGTIDYVSNQVSAGTGTLNVRGQFPNEQRLLTPGLFCRVRLPIGRPHPAVLVAERALGSDQGQRFLLVVDDQNQVARRDVQIGALHDGGLREITAGLHKGESVIVDGLLRVRPGVTVAPRRQPMPVQPSSQPSGNGTTAKT